MSPLTPFTCLSSFQKVVWPQLADLWVAITLQQNQKLPHKNGTLISFSLWNMYQAVTAIIPLPEQQELYFLSTLRKLCCITLKHKTQNLNKHKNTLSFAKQLVRTTDVKKKVPMVLVALHYIVLPSQQISEKFYYILWSNILESLSIQRYYSDWNLWQLILCFKINI